MMMFRFNKKLGLEMKTSLVRPQDVRPGLEMKTSLVRPQDARPGLETPTPGLADSGRVYKNNELGPTVRSSGRAFGKTLGLWKKNTGNMAEYALPAIDLFKRTAGQGLSRARGNMAEYALPAMLVGLVALGGFAALMNGNFAQTGALGLFQSTQTTQDAQGRTQLLARQFGENPTLRALSYVTEKGNRITLPAFPVDLSAVVEVDGVDGATDKLLSSLENWIDQLVASGELTEAEAAPLRELANQGHNLGGSVAQVEQALQNCGADKACVNTKIHQPGSPLYMAVNNSYVATAKNAQGVAGFEIPKAQDWEALEALMPGLRDIVLNGPSFEQRLEGVALSGGLYAFLQKYQAASQAVSGSPINQEILRVLSSSVWNLSHATSSVAFRTGQLVYREGVDLPESSPYVQQRPDQLHELVALEMVRTSGQMTDLQNSLKVHQSAGGICQMGQGQDSGTQCH